ncbi:MAG: hypothetical protein H7Z71_07120 [Moraxellaceae bacterium]|nr:hypothetical protein [Pseudobdellovibrionaceae bacterium]
MTKKLNENRNLILTTILASLLIATFSFGCSPKSFQTQNSLSSSKDNTSSGTGDTVVSPVASIESIDLKGQVQDGSGLLGFNGALAFDFDKTNGVFIIMVPMPSGLMFNPSGSFSQYPDITFGPVFDATGKMKMGIRVPIKYVLKGVNLINPAKLPSGEALPSMPAGKNELPSLALQFPQNNNIQLHLYIGINALAVYMTLPGQAALPLPFNLTLPLKNKDKTLTTGYLTYVTAKNGYAPGLFVSTIIPASIARILEDHFHLN